MATPNRNPHPHPHQAQLQTTQPLPPNQPPSKSTQILTIITLLPLAATLLALAASTLVGTVIGLAAATPLLVFFSPVFVPMVLTAGVAVAGLLTLTSGTVSQTGLSSLSLMANNLRQVIGTEQVEMATRQVRELVEYTGQKIKDAGHQSGEEGQVHGGARI